MIDKYLKIFEEIIEISNIFINKVKLIKKNININKYYINDDNLNKIFEIKNNISFNFNKYIKELNFLILKRDNDDMFKKSLPKNLFEIYLNPKEIKIKNSKNKIYESFKLKKFQNKLKNIKSKKGQILFISNDLNNKKKRENNIVRDTNFNSTFNKNKSYFKSFLKKYIKSKNDKNN